MGTDLSVNRNSWLYRLDIRKVILIAFLARFIFAAAYDCFVTVTDKDILLPDSKFYSVRGRYISLLFSGYNKNTLSGELVPGDKHSQYIFADALAKEGGKLPIHPDESTVFTYIVGLIYLIFGYFPFWIRVLNIALSVCSACLLFSIARRQFGDLTARIFLLAALFLPTQFMYSITLTRDFVRMFVITLILWVIYGEKG